MRPSFSIITIVFNDVENILKTINSVISQTYKNIEYILIDGQSTDGTKEKILEILQSLGEITLLEENSSRLYLKGTLKQYPTFSFQFLSEKDQGIYDAMNKGIALANKDWINFMNCGDRFYTSEVLESLSRENLLNFDVIYGDTEIYYADQNIHLLKYAPNQLKQSLKQYGNNLIHQSCFFKTQLHKTYPYSFKKYKIASDYELIYKLYTNQAKFKKINLTISIFSTGGTSDTKGFERNKECFLIALQYNKNILYNSYYFLFATLKKAIKLYCPNLSKTIIQNIKNLSPPPERRAKDPQADDQPFFSIIIPVFNTQDFIAQCIQSCIKQTFTNIEILIVDDCGNDHSMKIAQEYANQDKRIKIIHNTKNLGLFHTRRIGEQKAKGQYILHLDSDDYLKLETCEILFTHLKNKKMDILHFGASYKNNSKLSIHSLLHYCRYILPEVKQSSFFSQKEIMKHFFITPYHFPRFAMWGKVFSRELLIKAWKLFPKDQITHVTYAEDALFLFHISLIANSYQTIPNRLYIYTYTSTSATQSKHTTKKRLQDIQALQNYLKTIYPTLSGNNQKACMRLLNIAQAQYFIQQRLNGNYTQNCKQSLKYWKRSITCIYLLVYYLTFGKIKL